MTLTWLTVAALLGILVLTPSLIELRVYLGRRAQGVGPILVDALLLAQAVLLAVFTFVAARLAGWSPSPRTLDILRFALGLAFAVKPWITYVRLTRWRTATPDERSRRAGIPDGAGEGE